MLIARLLATKFAVDVFEAGDHIGGHAHSVDVDIPHQASGRSGVQGVSADVAFMVLNRRTYPNFCKVLSILGVDTQESDMSLSVRCFRSGLEYQGSSLNGVFAQRRNLIRAAFYRMLRDIVRFNSLAREFCESPDGGLSLGGFLDNANLGREFREQYLYPMSAAIWSTDPAGMAAFPAKFILGFLRNHGLLQINDRPQWLTIAGRSRRYVAALTSQMDGQIFVRTPIIGVSADGNQVQVTSRDLASGNQVVSNYDHVVFATHADQTLNLLKDSSPLEKAVLGGFPYQPNEAVLHTDMSVLPVRKRAWASWNYHIPEQTSDRVSVTYDLNRLQSLGLSHPLCLTLNPNCSIDSTKVIRRFEFQHPVFSAESIRSQQRFAEINHQRGISYCGAYWGYGFHEDGVNSALAAAKPFGLDLQDLRRPVLQSSGRAPSARLQTIASGSSASDSGASSVTA
ncbi:Flavin containing amine oxidoreductase [Planctomycetes bacterium K23_9]|uniref:Flavin containing amine oxidoreductase n=2 Tax=Stieleria marina TaxID=1930275 RepID=A0A517NRJ7_9BACT|nr:Flavin containing amine oxidoreductase [Planctomycetes bacterium K23_9]